MTNSQINSILNDLNYSMDIVIPLTEVSCIVLEGNFNIYPDGMQQFKFDSNNELLLVYNGREENGSFVPNEKPRYVHAFDQILAFQMVNSPTSVAPYRFGLQQ